MSAHDQKRYRPHSEAWRMIRRPQLRHSALWESDGVEGARGVVLGDEAVRGGSEDGEWLVEAVEKFQPETALVWVSHEPSDVDR